MMRRGSVKAGRLLSVALAFGMILCSIFGTGLSAYAKSRKDIEVMASDRQPKNCWRTVDGKTYFYDTEGNVERDAYRYGYYLNKDGSWDGKEAVPGWKEGSAGWNFRLSSGDILKNTWKKINGKWYFFEKDGVMASNRWLQSSGKWYYLGKDGAMVTGWKKISGKWYYFKNGEMKAGWLLYKKIWYFLRGSGDMATGWKKIKGTWYYFDEQGRMYTNAYIDRKYFVDKNGAWDGVTIKDTDAFDPGDTDTITPVKDGETSLTFHQDGWYVARLEVQVWDKNKEDFVWKYSDSCAKGQKTVLTIDTDRYEINRVGYQIWFFGWNNDYMNIPWANSDYATDFTLSGSGDYPEFDWK